MKLCGPAIVYLVLAIIALVFNMRFSMVSILLHVAFIGLWTFILNWICSKGFKWVSWGLVVLPYLFAALVWLIGVEIMAINGKEGFREGYTTSEIQAFTTAQLQSFTSTQIAAFSPVDIKAFLPTQIPAFTSTQIAAFTSTQIAAFTPTQIAAFRPEQYKLLSLDQVKALTQDQLRKLAENNNFLLTMFKYIIFCDNDFLFPLNLPTSGPTQKQFQDFWTIITPYVANITITDIQNYPTNRVNSPIPEIRMSYLVKFTKEQFQAFKPEHIANFTQKQMMQFSSMQIDSFTPQQIAALNPTFLAELSSSQIQRFSSSQISAFTTRQISLFTPTLISKFTPAQRAAFPTPTPTIRR